jgi:hypothetical protein
MGRWATAQVENINMYVENLKYELELTFAMGSTFLNWNWNWTLKPASVHELEFLCTLL